MHWYDSARNGIPDAQQERIGELPKVKLRLGRFGVNGEQKGVDLRMGLDLVAHARNRASDVFFLVSGDDDLAEAVEEAQVHGVQVLLLAVPTVEGKAHGVSRHLIRLLMTRQHRRRDRRCSSGQSRSPTRAGADSPAPVVYVNPRRGGGAANCPNPAGPRQGPARPVGSTTEKCSAYSVSTWSSDHSPPGYWDDNDEQGQLIDDVVTRVLASFQKSATGDDQLELRRARPSIPPDIDRALLLDACEVIQKCDLDERIRYRLRARFWMKYDEPQP